MVVNSFPRSMVVYFSVVKLYRNYSIIVDELKKSIRQLAKIHIHLLLNLNFGNVAFNMVFTV